VEPLQVPDGRDAGRLALLSTVASPAAQHQVPDPVQIDVVDRQEANEGKGKEMVHVARYLTSSLDADTSRAIEALALVVIV